MQKFRYVNDSDIRGLLHNIVREIAIAGWKPGSIVSPSRGGLSIGTMLSHYYDVPLFPIELSTRDHADESRSDIMIMNSLSRASLRSPNILFVDDINDTGRTLATMRDIVDHMEADGIVVGDIRYAVLLEKNKSNAEADYVGEHVYEDREQEWVVFPWENWWSA